MILHYLSFLYSSEEALSAAHTQDMGSYPLLPGGGNIYVNYLQFSLKGDLSLHLWQEKGLTEDEMLRWHHQLNEVTESQTRQWLNNNISHTHTQSEVAQPSPTLCDPMDLSLPGSSVHGTHQARVLEWVAISFSEQQPPPLICLNIYISMDSWTFILYIAS